MLVSQMQAQMCMARGTRKYHKQLLHSTCWPAKKNCFWMSGVRGAQLATFKALETGRPAAHVSHIMQHRRFNYSFHTCQISFKDVTAQFLKALCC